MKKDENTLDIIYRFMDKTTGRAHGQKQYHSCYSPFYREQRNS